jgi:hypothetical protein
MGQTWQDLVGTLKTSLKIGKGKATIDAGGLSAARTYTLYDGDGEVATRILRPGSTALAPQKFQTGTNLTTPEAGAMEYDGKVPYFSHVASARGVLAAMQFAAIQVDLTLTAGSGVQPCFPAANNLITLAGSTAYFFEGQYILTTGATSHTEAMAFALAGGASVTSIDYYVLTSLSTANTPTATQVTCYVNQVASTVVNNAAANTLRVLKFWGILRVNAGGTFEPQINFSVNPTGTNLMKVGSYISFTPIGSNTVQALGNWA